VRSPLRGHDWIESGRIGQLLPACGAESYEGSDKLAVVAEALAAVEQWDRAERVARAIPDLEAQVRALAALAGALVAVDLDRALAVAAEAEDAARTIPTPTTGRRRGR